MTDKTDTAKANGKRVGGILGVTLARVGVTALFGWVGVLALGDLGVSVPFMGAWLGFLVALYVVKTFVSEASAAFHTARVEADINLIAASMAAQEAIQHPFGDVADFLKTLDPENQDNGGYL